MNVDMSAAAEAFLIPKPCQLFFIQWLSVFVALVDSVNIHVVSRRCRLSGRGRSCVQSRAAGANVAHLGLNLEGVIEDVLPFGGAID